MNQAPRGGGDALRPRGRMARNRCCDAFSLVELLTVIVVISILVSILIPVIQGLRKSAATTETVTNLRSLQQANVSYAADHQGRYAPLFVGPAVFEKGWKWNEAFLEYLEIDPETPDAERTVLHSGFWDKNTKSRATIGYSAYKVSGGNDPWESGGQTHANLTAVVDQPAHLIAFIDANDWWVNPYQFDDWKSPTDDLKVGGRTLAAPAYRNKGEKAAAVTYAGNVLMLSREQLDWKTDEGKQHWFYDGKQ